MCRPMPTRGKSDATNTTEADKVKADDPTISRRWWVDEAKAIEFNKSGKVFDGAIVEAADAVDTAEANETNVAIATNNTDKVDEAGEEDLANEANDVNGTNEADKLDNQFGGANVVAVGAEGHDATKGQVAIVADFYSLTKYSAIVAEVKGYFGIDGCNNQLAGMVWSCLHSLRFRHWH